MWADSVDIFTMFLIRCELGKIIIIFMNNCVDMYSSVTVMNSLNMCMYPIEHVSDYYKSVCM